MKSTFFAAAISLPLLLSGMGVSAVAAAPVQLGGAWSYPTPAINGGVDLNTLELDPSGRFVRVTQLAIGAIVRDEGTFQVQWTSPNALRLVTRTEAQMPQVVCISGGMCEQTAPPTEIDQALVFTSPDTLQAGALTLHRDADPYLLQQAVPAQEVLPAAMPAGGTAAAGMAPAAPVVPYAPVITPYQTPEGPGLDMSNAAHQGAQDFINLYERGCSKDDDGNLYGCDQ